MHRLGTTATQYLLCGCAAEADRTDYELELDRKACLEHGVRLGVRLAQLTRSQDERTADITEVGLLHGQPWEGMKGCKALNGAWRWSDYVGQPFRQV